MAPGVINMSTAVYINNSDDRSNGNVMEGDDNNGEEEEEQLRGATANPVAPVDLGILSLDDEDLTLVRFSCLKLYMYGIWKNWGRIQLKSFD